MLRNLRKRIALGHGAMMRARREAALRKLAGNSRLLLEPLEPRLVLDSGTLVISELMAINGHTLEDEDSDYSDWIEIYNPGANTVNLEGWSLTDDPGDLTKWSFPDVSLPPGDYLVVFASGKDRTDPQGELHTNFQLAGEGEYLALVEDDGCTIAHQYAPAYPQQYEDVSYGLTQETGDTVLVGPGDDATVLVPLSEPELDPAWNTVGFDDSGWTAGTTGVGYDTESEYDPLIGTDVEASMLDNNASAFVRTPFAVSVPSEVESLLLRMKYDDGYAAYINGVQVAERYAPASPQWDSTATGEHGDAAESYLTQDFDVAGTGYNCALYGNWPAAQVEAGGPDGNYLRLINDGVTSNVNRATFDKVHDGAATQVIADFDFRCYSDVNPNNPAYGFSFLLLPTAVYGDSGEGTDGSYNSEEPNVPGVFAVGFDLYRESSGINDVSAHWDGAEILNVRLNNVQIDLDAGVFHHAHIELVEAEGGSLVTVILTPDIMGTPGTPVTVIDDLFIAGLTPYESRVEFSGRTGNPTVSVDLDNIAVQYGASGEITYEDVDISEVLQEYPGLLQAGPSNVLAIQGLNITAADDDFLVLPELVAGRQWLTEPYVERYFSIPTPGTTNSLGGEAPSQVPTFSHSSGTYVNGFSLTLSAEDPEAVIYYTTNGSIPNEYSLVYTSPIAISTTSRIRARCLEPDHGLSPVVSQGFIFLDATAASFNSDVPLIVLDTYGMALGNTLLTPATAVFIETGLDGRADITDAPEFAGRSGLRIRGQTSESFPKKQYAFETWTEDNQDTAPIDAMYTGDLAVSLFGMPKESDWVIYAPYSEKSLMQNYLAYNWSNEIGLYAPRVRFCEVFVNTGGGKVSYPEDYVGVYIFMEKIKRDPDRVDIAKLLPTDNSEPEITGGYIYKKDKPGTGDVPWVTDYGQELRHVEPEAGEITPQQQAYLEGYINAFEAALYGPDFMDPDVGYRAYIDVDSYIDNWILIEMTKNIDGFRLSTYYNKDRGGKIEMGPIWDYNLSLGNCNYYEGWLAEGWYCDLLGNYDYPYWRRMFEDPDFKQQLVDRWAELRAGPFSTANLLADVDAAAAIITESQARNFQKWPILGTYIWPNWFIGDTWEEEVAWMRDWLEDRVAWMDTQFLTAPAFNQEGGQIDPGFELVISSTQGSIYYTLDGSDPRAPGGGVSATALPYGNIIEYTTLIPQDSTWNYLDNGSDQGTAWREIGFDDSSWQSGPAELGYGDGDEATVLSYGGDPNHKYITYYFRYTFTLSEEPDFDTLDLEVLRDDGVIVYLNGAEIYREDLPEGEIDYLTEAINYVTDDGNDFHPFTADPGLLVQGENVLAAEIHQDLPTSSDISFNFRMVVSETGFAGDPIILTESNHVIARVRGVDEWSAVNDELFFVHTPAAADNLVITELNYNPYPLTAEEIAQGYTDESAFEFVELRNVSSDIVDLDGAEFVQEPEGITFAFLDGDVHQLGPGEFVVLAREPEPENVGAFAYRYPGVTVGGWYTGKLSNAGEQLTLKDAYGQNILQFEYGDSNDGGWPDRADGNGSTLELTDSASVPSSEPQRTEFLEDGANWRSSSEYLGSPGWAGDGPDDRIVISEVLTHTDPPLVDSIELHNTTSEAIDIGGWWLSDSNGQLEKFQIPAGTIIAGYGYLVFDEDDFNPLTPPPGQVSFALDGAKGEDVWLMKGTPGGGATHFVDHVEFCAAVNGESFGRWENSVGETFFYPMTERTLDPPGANSGPRVGPELVISEVMYAPPDPGGGVDPEDLEFVEIFNPTSQTVSLYTDSSRFWRLDKGIDFDFPAGTTLAPREALVVVRFDPAAEPDKAAYFRNYYGISGSVQIVGGHTDRLDNAGELVQLQDWDEPTLIGDPPEWFTPHTLEDEVDYEPTWCPSANGGGDSLNRLGSHLWGDEPTNWAAASPTPGSVQMTSIEDRYVFYNNSSYDTGLGKSDDTAIAPDKEALLPGYSASFANYTSYVLGINGIMIDVFDLANPAGLGATDFSFKVGNDSTPEDWTPLGTMPAVSVREGEGTGGSDRVVLVWPDNTIRKQWLEVTMEVTGNTGLGQPYVFYFGNAVGETGDSQSDARVDANDILQTRNNPHPFFNPATITCGYDFDRDQRVDAYDLLIVRNNQTTYFNDLELFRAPFSSGSKSQGLEGDPAPLAALPTIGVRPSSSSRASALDAVLERAAQQHAGSPVASSAKLHWLYEFEPIGMQQGSAKANKPVEDAVDKLLLSTWS